MAEGITIHEEEKNGVFILYLEGRLDATSSPTLEHKINEHMSHEHMQLLLDFSKVDYLSSAGMRLLLSATKKSKNQNGKLFFCSINDEVMEIIKMAGFEKILQIFQNESQALNHF